MGISEKALSYGTYEAKRMAYSDTVDMEAKGLVELLANAAMAVKSIGAMHSDALGRLAEIEDERSRLESERNELIEVRNQLRRKVVTVIREMHETGGQNLGSVTVELTRLHKEEMQKQESWFHQQMEKSRLSLQVQFRRRLAMIEDAQRRALEELTNLSQDESAFVLDEFVSYTSSTTSSTTHSQSGGRSSMGTGSGTGSDVGGRFRRRE